MKNNKFYVKKLNSSLPYLYFQILSKNYDQKKTGDNLL